MIRALILLVALAAPPRAAHWPTAGGGYVLSTGYPLGMLGLNVCTQVADDTTPDLFGAAAGGCNILETSPGHAGAVAITDLDNPLPGAIVWIVGADGAGASTTIADSGNFNLETTWTGTNDNVLELYVQADNDYVEVTRHNGVRYFDGLVTLDGGAVLGADLDTNGQTITDLTDGVVTVAVDLELESGGVVLAPAVATDAAPYTLTFKSGNPLHTATVNVDGSPLLNCGGIGVKSMAAETVGAAGSTITITTTDAAGTYTSTTLTFTVGAPGALEIQCITSDAICAAAIVSDLATRGLGVTAEAVAAQVFLIPEATMCAMGLASANGTGTKFVLTNGDDGQILIGADGIRFTEEYGAGLLYQSLRPVMIDGGNLVMAFRSGNQIYAYEPIELQTATDPIRGKNSTSISFIADGQTRFCNALENQCFTLGASAADTATLWDKAGTGAATFIASSIKTTAGGNVILDGDNARLYFSGSNSSNSAFDTEHNSRDQLVFRFGVNHGRQLVIAPGINQIAVNTDWDHAVPTHPAIYMHSDLDPDTDNGEYSGWSYDGLRSGSNSSDRVPADFTISGSNAYAQATGASRNGADLNNAGGIRTLQIVCSDPTLTDTDLATFVVDGADTVLTESTDWDCHGETAEVCCDNFGTVITTNVATIKMVPDCDTVAGTCFLTPLEDVLWVEDIYFSDGGVDDVGWTLTEGTDGDIGLYGDDILTKLWTVDYVVRAGTAGMPPAAPAWGVNDSCAGLAFDADAEYANISFEVPSCWSGRARDDFVLKIYWCPEDAQNPDNAEAVKWDISYRVLDWGTDDVDTNAAVTGTVTYTQSGGGDEGDTFVSEITIDADDTDQPLVAGEVLAIHFDRDWGDGANYPHDAIVALWEISVPQTSLKCDHHN